MQQSLILLFQNQSLHICPNIEQQKHRWCAYEVTDTSTSIIQSLYLGLVLGLLVVLCIYSRKIIRYRSNKYTSKYFSNIYVYIYAIIFGWIACSIARAVLCITVFYTYMYNDFKSEDGLDYNGPDPPFQSNIVVLTSVFTFFNYTSALLVNLLIIVIPYQWLKASLQNINQKQSITLQTRKALQKWFVILNIIKIYLKYIRSIFFLIDILQPILFFNTQFMRCSMSNLNNTCMVIDSSVILVLLAIGAYISNYLKQNQLIKIKKEDQKKFIIQYTLILISSISRIILNLYMIYFFDSQYAPNHNCSDRNTTNDFQQNTVLLLHHGLMHLLPIVIVMYVYRPNVQNEELFKSLLDSQNSENTTYSAKKFQIFIDKLQRASVHSTQSQDQLIMSSTDAELPQKCKSEVVKRGSAQDL